MKLYKQMKAFSFFFFTFISLILYFNFLKIIFKKKGKKIVHNEEKTYKIVPSKSSSSMNVCYFDLFFFLSLLFTY